MSERESSRTPLFSVIIPTYSRPDFLPEAIDSVLGQTVNDLECLVVDDAGPVPAAVPDDPRVRLIRRDLNGGEPAARNTGIQEARGRFLVFLDDDDVFTRDRLQIALEGLERAPLALCYRGGMDGAAGGNRELEGNVHDSIVDRMTPQMGQVAIERTNAPLFNTDFEALTDVDWWLRASENTSVATVPQVGIRYRTHSGPRNRNGIEARVIGSLLLLSTYEGYFNERPRAAAFRWKRIGIMANSLGDRHLARRALLRSLGLRFDVRAVKHLIAGLGPSSENLDIPSSLKSVLGQGVPV
jgi:glycosyltransferase involved in cell wall biosynthesis